MAGETTGALPIVQSTGGAFGSQDFKKATGLLDLSNVGPNDGGEEGEGDSDASELETFGEKKTGVVTKTEGSEHGLQDDEEGTSEESEETSGEEEEVTDLDADAPEVKGRGIKLKTKDGKEYKLPPDATIIHKVDGEYREINLNDAINREVGEITVESRLQELNKVKPQLEGTIKKLEAEREERDTFLRDVSALAVSDQPDLAFAKIAERAGQTPGAVLKNLFSKAQIWAAEFERRGLTADQMDSYFNQIDIKFYESKEKSRKEDGERKAKDSSLASSLLQKAEEVGVTLEDISAAIEEMQGEGIVINDDAELVSRTSERALAVKHRKMVDKAFEGLPTLQKNTKLKAAILASTNTRDFTTAEIRKIAVDAMRAPAQAPAVIRKGQKPVAKSDKPTVANRTDFKKLFGM